MYTFLILFCMLFNFSYGDLYNETDPMVILNKTNSDVILNVPNAWIIEFYNSWCGHCITYVDKWRSFADDVKEWNHTIKVAVVDCSNTENTEICRSYGVLGYPTVRLFGPNIISGDNGQNIKDRFDLQKEIISFLTIKETDPELEIPDTWAQLTRFKGHVKDIFDHAPKEATYAALIIQKNDSTVAQHVIMDFGNYKKVYIRWMKPDENDELTKEEAVLIIDRNGFNKVLTKSVLNREELANLLAKDLNLPLKKDKQLFTSKSPEDVKTIMVPKSIDEVYLVDIENALSYAFSHEVILHQTVSDEKYEALLVFVASLVAYLPSRPPIHQFLLNLQENLKDRKSISGEKFDKLIKKLNTSDSVLPSQKPYVGCKGSKPYLRGYSCGLWTMFHTLTVSAYNKYGSEPNYDPKDVLQAIHSFVKYFYSCEDCSKHFQEMYAEDAETAVKSIGDEVLWLWKGHNKVNERTKGSRSEDPLYPKQQFPSSKQCPACYESSTYKEDQVLKFLLNYYNHDSFSLKGVQDIYSNYRQGQIFNNKRLISHKFLPNKGNKINSWSFNTADISLCVVLYISSTLLIIAGYCMFNLKRRLRKKKFIF